MLDVLFVIALLGATGWVAFRAFANPRGVYLRSVIGVAGTVLVALAVWWAASTGLANEAGLGAFILFCVVSLLAAGVALAACLAATLRHLCDAFGPSAGRG
jgi:hypothetical protein